MQYQYTVITIRNASDEYLSQFLNSQGVSGWELVQVLQTTGRDMLKFILKRAVETKEEDR